MFEWKELGTLSKPMSTTSLEWADEVYRSEFTVTLSVSPPAIRRMLGAEHGPRVPVFWPRMKWRAARRRAGYTRTGRRR